MADAGKRYETFQRAEDLLLAEAPVTPLYYGAQTYLIHPAVSGWEPAPLVFRRFQIVELK
jgi:oligopeptide transport system substrate-binding protein